MNVIILSSDPKTFDRQHDSFTRMKEYSELVDSLDVIVFCGDKKIETSGKLTIYSLKTSVKFLQPFYCLALAWKLSKQKKINAVVTQDPIFYGLCGYLIARLTKAKLLVSAYGTNIFNVQWQGESLNNRLRFFLGRFILKAANAIQADGFEDVEDIRAHYGDKVFWKPIVPSNIDEFLKIERLPYSDEFKILFVGRLVKQKNIPYLLEIIKEIIDRKGERKIKFTIIGDGPLREYLQEQIEIKQLKEFVDYRSECSRLEIVKIYAEHQILILASFYEGFAKVLMEAAAAGLPIVTTRVSGVSNVIKDQENSFIVEQGDLNSFVDRVMDLADQSELRNDFSRRLKADFSARYQASLTIQIQKQIFDFLAKTNVLILTQVLDINHGILGFFHRWVEEFAKDGKRVTVICLNGGEHHLPNNVKVISLGKDKGGSRFRYLWNFYRYIWCERNNYDVVFVHMNQVYVILGWLSWKLLGKPVGLWYAHGATPWDLRVAVKLTDHVFTSTPEGCRIISDKIRVVGQGIDTDFFTFDATKKINEGKLRVLTVGRISPVKDYETLIRAADLLRNKSVDFEVQIIGGPGSTEQEKYLDSLRLLVEESNLLDRVKFLGPLSQSRIINYLQSADIFVNMSHTGSLDKAILEAMACELPILTSNEAVANELGEYCDLLMFKNGDYEKLAERMEYLNKLPPTEKEKIKYYLRSVVESNHGLEKLITKIMNIYG